MTFNRTDSTNKDFIALVTLLDQDLKHRDGDEHSFYAQYNKIETIRNVIICYVEEKPIGCGAFKVYSPGKAEIKRMFVLPAYRGQGVGLNILQQLELWASELKYSKCVLETGIKQPEAITLYKKAGYSIIKNYGQYENVENSVCMQRSIL